MLNGDSYILIMSLINNQELQRILIDNYEDQEKVRVRMSHIGFIIQIANKIQNFILENNLALKLDSQLQQYLDKEIDRQNIDFT